jgi:hypothetical protein
MKIRDGGMNLEKNKNCIKLLPQAFDTIRILDVVTEGFPA